MPLPPGLALNPTTGVVSGTPTEAGTYNFTLRVRDAQGNTRDIPQSITIAAYTAPSLSGSIPTFAKRTVAYSGGLSVANGTAPYVWSIASGTLPTGLTIDAGTGVISGTPTDTTYTDRPLTIRVVDAVGSSAQQAVTLRYADVLTLGGTYANATEAVAYSDGLDAAGGHLPRTWAITSGSLPSGLTFNTSTGVISGTSSDVSSVSLGISVTDASGDIASGTFSLSVVSAYTAISITGNITNGVQNVETLSAFSIMPTYSGLVIAGGTGSYSYSWARISGSTAINAGSPTSLSTSFVGTVAPGASTVGFFRLTVSDGISSATYDFTASATNTYVVMTLGATVGRATRTVAYTGTLNRGGGKSPFSFVVTAGTLPAGITLNAGTGALSGTPTDTSYTDRSMTFRVTDDLGATANVSATIGYRNFPTLSYPASFAMRTRAYSLSPTQSGGHSPLAYALQSGSLITGLSLSSTTGEVTGTPTSTSYGVVAVTVRLTDDMANVVDAAQSVTYADNLTIAGTVASPGYTGAAYADSSLSASGGHGSNVWSIASGSLPPGVSINAGSGALTGTPSAVGAYGFTVRVTDAAGFVADSPQSLTIALGLSVSLAPTLSYLFTNSPASGSPGTRTLTTGTVTGTASGGSGGYSYAWTRIAGSADITADSPAAATTAFTGTGIPIGGNKSATFRLTVTDSGGRTATADIVVEISYESGL